MFFRAFWFPIFQNRPRIYQHPIEDIIPKPTKPPRPRGRGSPRKRTEARNVSFRPCFRVFRCFRTFRFPIFQNHPPSRKIYRYRPSGKILKLTKPPRHRGRGRRRKPAEARNFSPRPGFRVSRCFASPFGFPFSKIPSSQITNILYRI